jgi:hypothetical protein
MVGGFFADYEKAYTQTKGKGVILPSARSSTKGDVPLRKAST